MNPYIIPEVLCFVRAPRNPNDGAVVKVIGPAETPIGQAAPWWEVCTTGRLFAQSRDAEGVLLEIFPVEAGRRLRIAEDGLIPISGPVAGLVTLEEG